MLTVCDNYQFFCTIIFVKLHDYYEKYHSTNTNYFDPLFCSGIFDLCIHPANILIYHNGPRFILDIYNFWNIKIQRRLNISKT